jgi:hypothetical protein
MNAGAQDLFGFLHVRVGELRQREIGLHARRIYRPAVCLSFSHANPELSLESRPFEAID